MSCQSLRTDAAGDGYILDEGCDVQTRNGRRLCRSSSRGDFALVDHLALRHIYVRYTRMVALAVICGSPGAECSGRSCHLDVARRIETANAIVVRVSEERLDELAHGIVQCRLRPGVPSGSGS